MSKVNLLEGYASPAEIGADIGRCERTIFRWMGQEDGLPYVKIGNRRLVHIETAKQWIFDRMQRPNPTHGRKAGAR
jgi:hypothetical protein